MICTSLLLLRASTEEAEIGSAAGDEMKLIFGIIYIM